jgi:hypothetical protein
VGGLYTTANERCRFCSFKVPTKPVLVLTVHQKQRSDIYAAVKKLCLCELGIASQVSDVVDIYFVADARPNKLACQWEKLFKPSTCKSDPGYIFSTQTTFLSTNVP